MVKIICPVAGENELLVKRREIPGEAEDTPVTIAYGRK
jgi:hypothetical protein